MSGNSRIAPPVDSVQRDGAHAAAEQEAEGAQARRLFHGARFVVPSKRTDETRLPSSAIDEVEKRMWSERNRNGCNGRDPSRQTAASTAAPVARAAGPADRRRITVTQ